MRTEHRNFIPERAPIHARREIEHERLTIASIEHDLHFLLVAALQCMSDLFHRLVVGILSVEKLARARLLNDVRARVTAQRAEGIVAVDDRFVRQLGVGDEKPTI